MAAATDDATVIGELACMLLDRALDQRAAPLRLVGVGVSGLEPVAQLALVADHEAEADAEAHSAPPRRQPSSRP
jgi:hypothetical protein